MKAKNSGMTLLETMITIALFSLVMLGASQAVIRGMSVWGLSAKETAATWNLQQGMNVCFMDLLRAKLVEVTVDSNSFSKVKIQMPVEYTKTGADGKVDYYVIYEVRDLAGEYALYRDVYMSSGVKETARLLVRGIDGASLDTKIDDPDNGAIKGFSVIQKTGTKEFTIYLRLKEMIDPTSERKRELLSKVYVRNL